MQHFHRKTGRDRNNKTCSATGVTRAFRLNEQNFLLSIPPSLWVAGEIIAKSTFMRNKPRYGNEGQIARWIAFWWRTADSTWRKTRLRVKRKLNQWKAIMQIPFSKAEASHGIFTCGKTRDKIVTPVTFSLTLSSSPVWRLLERFNWRISYLTFLLCPINLFANFIAFDI